MRPFITANDANIENEQEFAAPNEDDSFNSDDIEHQIQEREAEAQRLAEQRDTYFAQMEE